MIQPLLYCRAASPGPPAADGASGVKRRAAAPRHPGLQETCPIPALPRLREALAAHAPRLADASRRAAVAAVLRPGPAGEDLLFIHRAEHPLDPWSGHMAFPGGGVDPGDAGPQAAAERETLEEVGLDLASSARLLGRLSDVAPMALRRPLSIAAFVYELTAADVALTTNEEVQEAVWIPFSFLADPARRSSFFWSRNGVPVPMPCCQWEGRIVWGLTLRMVDELVWLAGRDGRRR